MGSLVNLRFSARFENLQQKPKARILINLFAFGADRHHRRKKSAILASSTTRQQNYAHPPDYY